MRRLWLMSVLLVPMQVRAQGSTRLTWNAPDDCPTRAQVLAQCGGDCGEATVTATVVRDVDGVSVVLQFSAPFSGERRLQVLRCADAAEATAFFIRMVAMPNPDEPPPAPADLPNRATPTAASTEVRGFLLAQGQLQWLGLPSARIGGGLSFGLQADRWRLALSLTTLAPVTIEGGATPGVAMWLQGVLISRLGAAARFTPGGVTLAPGAVAEVEWLRVAGLGVRSARSDWAVRVGVGASLFASVSVWRSLFVSGEISVLANLVRPQVFFDVVPDLVVVGPVEADAKLGVGTTF